MLPPKRLVEHRQWRVLAIHLTWTVLALQGAVLLTLAMTPNKTPPDGRLFELLWASARKPQFYPLIALILFAP
ncbi:MAG: hypothetical protein MI741_17335, partial [Rhodospirillales bacterium]|nr:hypothetical protein [Rhodospirillales bacterium]